MSNRLNEHELECLFPGDSELAGRMRDLDWSKTDLGPPENWPENLRIAVSLCLTSRIPIVMYWGPNFTVLYNDPYISFLGETKHPSCLGQPGREVWREIWDTIGPMLEGVYATKKATWSEDVLMFFARRLPLEEVYVRFTFGPILSRDGRSVEGIFCPCTETTEQVVGARRLETLRKLGVQAAAETRSVEAACERAASILAENPHDIPFAAIYLLSDTGTEAALRASASFHDGHDAFPFTVALTGEDESSWPLARVSRTQYPEEVADLTVRLSGGPYPEPVAKAVVLPIVAAQQTLAGLLVVGVSPRRLLDADYWTFCNLVAGHIGSLIADAKAYDAERKRAEALAELDRAKTAFFSNVSHEFRTPLTLMLGPVEDLLAKSHTDPSPTVKGELEVVHRNSLRLLKLVNTLLDFSRIEARRIQASYEPTELDRFTSELASVFRSAMERAGMRLFVDCPPLPEPVYVDREMWEKIVLNLLSNAFKFTFEGEITVSLRWADGHVELDIQDTGTGIPEEELPHIFERFHRVPNARSRTYEGSGIGLALVQELVRLHGGTIAVSSVVGGGTTFTVSIPTGSAHIPADRIKAVRTGASTAVAVEAYVEEAVGWMSESSVVSGLLQEATDDGQRTADKPAYILLADDNADMREYVKRLLSQKWEVRVVENGVAALETTEERTPDLVLTDVMMPEMDGFKLLQKLRDNPRTKTVPVIMLSARAGEEARVEGLQAGADDYLIKPFSAKELMARVETHLEMARVRREAYLREQELRFEAESAKESLENVLASINDQFLVLDRDWRYVYVNDRMARTLGRAREEILGKNIWELLPDVVGSKWHIEAQRAMSERVPVCFEYLYPAWNRWFENHIYPSPDGVTILLTEITERKRTEQLLIEQKNLLELIAAGNSSDECLTALTGAVARLEPHTRACLLLADAERKTFSDSYATDIPPSFGAGLKDAPINDLAIGTCGEAVYCGQPITCTDIANDEKWSKMWRDLCVAHGILACHSEPVMGSNGLPLASLMLCFDKAREPSDWEYQIAKFGTHVASIAIERDRAAQALRDSEARLAVELADTKQLQNISSQLIQEDNINVLYEQILDAAITLMRSDMGSMQMLYPERNELLLLVWKGFDPASAAFWEWVRVDSSSSCGVALHKGERVVVPDAETCELIVGTEDLDFYRLSGIRAMQSTPLVSRDGRVVGMISTHWREPHQPSKRDLRLLDVLARQAADLIERKQAEETLQRARDELEIKVQERTAELSKKSRYEAIVNTITRSVHQTIDLQEVIENAVDAMSKNIDRVDYVGIFLVEGEEAVLKANRGYPDWFTERIRRIPYPKGATWKVIIDGKPIYCPDVDKDTVIGPAGREVETKSYLTMPIRSEEKIIGVININSLRKDAFGQDELWLLESVAQQIGTAISNARQAEMLRQSEERYRILFDQSSVGVYMFDKNFNIMECNERFVEILRSSRDRIVGLDVRTLKDTICMNAMKKVYGGEASYHETFYEATNSPAKLWVSERFSPLRNEDGNVVGGIAIVEDITERKRAEEERLKLDKLESVGILAGGIAHDFNNLLAVILTTVSLAKMNTPTRSEVYENLEDAENACHQARRLTQQLLTFSKGGAPVKRLASLEEIVKKSSGFALRGSKSRCDLSVGDGLWDVEADEGQISQVIHNLIINADQAMPGGGTIRIRVENMTVNREEFLPLQSGRFVKIIVGDEGTGIPRDHLTKVFDPYFTTKQKGSGLGLATVYSIINGHNGYIEVESELGVGTKFYIYLPASAERLEKRRASKRTRARRRKPDKRKKVLLMDDEALVRLAAGKALADLGYDVEYARDGSEAVEKYKSVMESGRAFDVVIMDLTIPGGMGGKEAMEKLIDIDPEVKAIVSSGYSNDPAMSEFRDYGFKGVVAKPYEVEELAEAINKVINGDKKDSR